MNCKTAYIIYILIHSYKVLSLANSPDNMFLGGRRTCGKPRKSRVKPNAPVYCWSVCCFRVLEDIHQHLVYLFYWFSLTVGSGDQKVRVHAATVGQLSKALLIIKDIYHIFYTVHSSI